MDHVDAMREAIASGRALVVVGTGVSSAIATDTEHCSWVGFLNAGLEYVKSNKLFTSQAKLDAIAADIKIGIEEDGDYLLTAAEKLVGAMGGKSSTHFTQYINQTIGNLKVHPGKRGLVQAINALGPRIVTTNYDTLLEEVSNRNSVDWTDSNGFRRAINGESRDVAHLHGIWSSPNSIILTSQDYGRLLANDFIETMKRGLGSLQSIIFIGFGSGLHDPSFRSLRRWLSNVIPGSTVHYQLCKIDEQAALAQQDLQDPILAVPYGSAYEELGPFVESLSPKSQPGKGGKAGQLAPHNSEVAATCRRQLLDRLSDASVIVSNNKTSSMDVELEDLVIEPILLPLPPDAFDHESARAQTPLKRLDAAEQIKKDQAILLVGDEHSGVTTALLWMVVKRSIETGAIPIYIDCLSFHPGSTRPVEAAVRKYLRAAGASLRNADSIPTKIVLALDNVGAGGRTSLRRLVDDALLVSKNLTIMGCHTGAELEIQDQFASSRKSCVPMYLGRVNRKHAIDLARRVNPSQAEGVADRALHVASREHLSRTPLSVTLLIIGVSSADSWVTSVSNTSFLDAFVDSLLGRGDPSVDARLQIDAAGYSLVLQHVAQRLVELDTASIGRFTLLEIVAESLVRLDWQDKADDVLRSLVAKGLLIDRDNIIRFRQSAYLHIFAAKRAENNGALLEIIRARPLYYSSIIRHYAALRRNDAELLKWAYDLLEPADSLPVPDTGVFADRDEKEIESSVRSLEALAVSLDIADDSEEDDSSRHHDDGESDYYDPYDSMHDRDRDPFPSPHIESAPLHVRITGLIALVSNIVRDSELVEDPQLKEQVLARALRVWGQFVSIASESDSFGHIVDSLVEAICVALEMSPERAAEFGRLMKEFWPLFMGLSGVQDELATIKLSKALNRIVAGEKVAGPVHLALMAGILAFQLDQTGWPEYLRRLWTTYGTKKIVRMTVLALANTAYMYRTDQRLTRQLEDLIVDIRISDLIDLSRHVEGKTREAIRAAMRKDRIIVRIRNGVEAGGVKELGGTSLPT